MTPDIDTLNNPQPGSHAGKSTANKAGEEAQHHILKQRAIRIPAAAGDKVKMEDSDSTKKDMTLTGVTDYDDESGEENDLSLKDMQTAMCAEFRTVSRKVLSFEDRQGSTQENVVALSKRMAEATAEQEGHRAEARAATKNNQ